MVLKMRNRKILVSISIFFVLLGLLLVLDGRVLKMNKISDTDSKNQVRGMQTEVEKIFKSITPKDAYFLIRNNQDNQNFIIIDVRTSQEYSQGHLENAINLDYYSDLFAERLNELDKNKTYLIYCRTGNRSKKTVDLMNRLNFKNVYDLLGGIDNWSVENLPVVR